jgi:hypothetical protein
VQARRRVLPLLHPGTLPAGRGLVGIILIVGLFVTGAALGLYVASLHHGVGPTAQTFEVSVNSTQMSPSHLRVRAGDQVILSITGDSNATIVLQGYNQRITLIPGLAVPVTFVAGKAGTYDFVTDGTGKRLGQLEVTG